MSGANTFTDASVERIRNVVQTVEGQVLDLRGPRRRRPTPAAASRVFARITGGGENGQYEADQVMSSGQTIAETDGGLRWGFGVLPALTELNRSPNVPVDRFVRVYNAGTSWVFLQASPFPPGGERHMPLTKASDDDGDVHWDWLRAHE